MKFAAFLYIFTLLLTFNRVSGQEHLLFPGQNTEVRKAFRNTDHKKLLTASDTLSLPFFDDFSGNTVYPDSSLWADRETYINFSYGVNPVSVGVATFDAIDETGAIYPQASQLTFEADHLTSRPIDLEFPPSAGIFLSFFYQPQGIADPPEPADSLVLLFFAPMQQHWDTVWHHAGDTLNPFKEVIIPITDTSFLHKGFRFRFVNFASLTRNDFDPGAITNCDHWNIDYVFLDKGRFSGDTLPRDVAFVRPIPSLLKTYEAMPWKHFRETFLSEMGSVFPITYRNNDSIIRNVTREFRIKDFYTGQTVYSFSGGASNAPAASVITYEAPLIYTFNSTGNDSALFEIRSYLVTDDFDRKVNDTISRFQVFRDEFAYDDGSAEAGYGLNGNGMEHASLAYRFHAYLPDTLKAVRIWFNRSQNDANLVYFNLVVWNDSSGIPGIEIHRQEGEKAVFTGNSPGFVTFPLDSAIIVDGDFYIGWEQVTSTFLNAGFDMNLDHHTLAFIHTAGQWKNSSIEGTIMIRPVFGRNISLSRHDNLFNKDNWKVYPNPFDRFIYLQHSVAGELFTTYTLRFFSLTGKMVSAMQFDGNPVDVSYLSDGIYLLVISDGNRILFRTKIIKMRR